MRGNQNNNNNNNNQQQGFIPGSTYGADSMQCSEVLTINQTNGFLFGSNNQLSTNSENLSNNNFSERFPEKKFKPNEPQQNQQAQQIKQQLLAKEEEKKVQSNLLKEFDFMQFKYSNDEFSYQINTFCKRIAGEKHAADIACKFPLYKMIRSIIKKFLFNELEIVFFGYVLEESKWKVDDIEVRKHAYFMNDFLNITEVKEVLDYKSVLLYLILTAYGVKYYLNEEADMKMFNLHMNTIVRDFTTLFSYWLKNYGQTSFKIVPKSLNRVYRNLTKKPSEHNKKQQEDYNALVDAIIQISPPYNNEKTQDQSPEHSLQVPAAKSPKPRKKSPSISGFHEKNSNSDLSSSYVPPPNSKNQLEQNKQEPSSKNKSKPASHSPLLSAEASSAPAKTTATSAAATTTGGGIISEYENFSDGIVQQNQLSQGSAKFGDSPTHGKPNRDLRDFPVDYNNSLRQTPSATAAATGLLPMSQNGEDNLMTSKIIQGFGSANFNDNMEFISNLNNPYNFNCSYPSLNIGSQLNNYSSFMQSNQMQIEQSNQSGMIGSQKTAKNSNGNSENIGGNSQTRGDFSSLAGAQGQSGAIMGGVGNSIGQSNLFTHGNFPFSSGFIGQHSINNNSFNSNQIGFSQLFQQFSANPGGLMNNNSSFSGLYHQSIQQPAQSTQNEQQEQNNTSSNPDTSKS